MSRRSDTGRADLPARAAPPTIRAMPVLPLFQTPAHPDAWHRVTAPGGYEWWYFDGEDHSGRFQFVATWFQGFPLHPDYLRRYHRYRRAPTRPA